VINPLSTIADEQELPEARNEKGAQFDGVLGQICHPSPAHQMAMNC
jgi:hypothetical protein